MWFLHFQRDLSLRLPEGDEGVLGGGGGGCGTAGARAEMAICAGMRQGSVLGGARWGLMGGVKWEEVEGGRKGPSAIKAQQLLFKK